MQKKFKLGTLQRKWIRALKSGKYKKTTGQLFNEKTNGYCCLGVANKCLNLSTHIEAAYLNEASGKALGLASSYGSIVGGDYRFPRGKRSYTSLAQMNDAGVSHAKIAEFLEKNPELVFTKSI